MSTSSTADLRPNPDPSVLTTQQLLREVGMLREVVDTRLSGMDKAINLLQQFTDKSPTTAVLEQQIRSLSAIMDVKLEGVQTQFTERDKRTEQLSIADKTAIAAALQAQKEAAGAQNESNATANTKTETNFAKLIEQGQSLLLEVRRNTEAQINDLKSRIDKGEGHSKGIGDGFGWLIGLAGIALAGVTLFIHHG